MKPNGTNGNGNGNGHKAPDRGGFDLEVFLSVLFARSGLVFWTIVLTIGAAVIFGVLAPSQYESSVKVLAEAPRETNPLLAEARGVTDRRAFIETQKEIVMSSSVMRSALAKLEKRAEKDFNQNDVERFASHITVGSRSDLGAATFTGSGIGASNVFIIKARSGDPEEAARMANAVVESYRQVAGRVSGQRAGQAVTSLEEAVKSSTERTQTAHKALAEFEAQAGPMLVELRNLDKETMTVYPEVEELRADSERARVEIAKAEAYIATLARSVKSSSEPPIPSELLNVNPTLTHFKGKSVELRTKLNELLPFYKEDAREISSVREELTLCISSMRAELESIRASQEDRLEVLKKEQAARDASLAGYEQRMIELSRANSKYAELRREYEGNAEALSTQLQALAEARISEASSSSEQAAVSVVDQAVPNKERVAPRFWLIVFLSIPLSLALGIFVAYVDDLLRPVFVHPRQVEQAIGLPVVATVARSR